MAAVDELELIGVCFDGGGGLLGQAAAPFRLRGAGLTRVLLGAGVTEDFVVSQPDPTRGPVAGFVNERALLRWRKQRVVLGRLGRKAIAADTDESVEQAMTPGPSTVRPSIGADALLERIRSRNLTSLLATTPDGRLVGLVLRSDLE